jgi:hypothetical protein
VGILGSMQHGLHFFCRLVRGRSLLAMNALTDRQSFAKLAAAIPRCPSMGAVDRTSEVFGRRRGLPF